MRLKYFVGLVLLFAGLCGCGSISLLSRPDTYKQRVLDDMYPILTTDEYKALDRLYDDRDIKAYIENFWATNDPTPGTIENELREEYEKRLAFANEHFPDRRGWGRSDRKRIYLQFGPPVNIERVHWTDQEITKGTRIKSAEIWLYAQGAKKDTYRSIFENTNPAQMKFIFYDTIGSEFYRLAYSSEDMQDIDAMIYNGVSQTYGY
ncbi:MAG: GWxTD domain-containing protein [archaeon]